MKRIILKGQIHGCISYSSENQLQCLTCTGTSTDFVGDLHQPPAFHPRILTRFAGIRREVQLMTSGFCRETNHPMSLLIYRVTEYFGMQGLNHGYGYEVVYPMVILASQFLDVSSQHNPSCKPTAVLRVLHIQYPRIKTSQRPSINSAVDPSPPVPSHSPPAQEPIPTSTPQ